MAKETPRKDNGVPDTSMEGQSQPVGALPGAVLPSEPPPIPTAPEPNIGIPLGLTEAQKRAALGLEPTPLDREQAALADDEAEYLRLALNWDATQKGEIEYPEDERAFHVKRLHGYLLIAEANVEQRRARIEALKAEQ